MIIVKNLHFSFSNSHPLFNGLNLAIDQNSSVCIVGRDGAGKSTLLRIIKGLIKPFDGSVSFCFSDPVTFNNVGYLGGDPYDSFVGSTVQEEIVFGPENMGIEVGEIRKRLDRALEITELQGYEKRLTHTLSGGEQQRLALAAVLVMDLKILVLDDALSMLDPSSRARHWSWINTLKRDLGLCIIFTTNKLDELRSANRVIYLDNRTHDFLFDGQPDLFIRGQLAEDWVDLENGVEKFARCALIAGYDPSVFGLDK